MYCSVDSGRDTTKAWDGENEVIKIPSVVGEWRELKLENSNPKWKVEIDGKKYFVGELARKECYCTIQNVEESKVHEQTKVLILTALALLKKPGALITSLPIDLFNQKQELADLLKGLHKVKVNDNLIPISILKVIFVPESVGIFYNQAIAPSGLDKTLNGKVRVLDIGSRTINYLTMDTYQYISKESGTLDYGCIEYFNSGANKESFLNRIKADLIKKVHNWKASDKLIIGGGGGELFKDELPNIFPLAALSSNCVNANCMGNLKVVKLWNENGK